jgi:hypothetical protein
MKRVGRFAAVLPVCTTPDSEDSESSEILLAPQTPLSPNPSCTNDSMIVVGRVAYGANAFSLLSLLSLSDVPTLGSCFLRRRMQESAGMAGTWGLEPAREQARRTGRFKADTLSLLVGQNPARAAANTLVPEGH